MKPIASIFLGFVTMLALVVQVHGLLSNPGNLGQIFQILFAPVTVYLVISLVSHLVMRSPVFGLKKGWVKLFPWYCLLISALLILAGFTSSQTLTDFISTLIFAPLGLYFLISIWPKRNWAVIQPSSQRQYVPQATPSKVDLDRRDFLKMIGTAGISIFLYNLVFRRDALPLFGGSTSSNPLALKNAQGEVINPAERSPTQGYYISQIDDSPTGYFGFINNLGQWFIMRQDPNNAYRYTRGDKDFTSNWEARAKLAYDYFDNVF
jgi:hypothetical protein